MGFVLRYPQDEAHFPYKKVYKNIYEFMYEFVHEWKRLQRDCR